MPEWSELIGKSSAASPAWVAFFREIRKQARKLAELEVQGHDKECRR